MSTEKKLVGYIKKAQPTDTPTSVVGQIVKKQDTQLTGSVKKANKVTIKVKDQTTDIKDEYDETTYLDGQIDSEQALPTNLIEEDTTPITKYVGPTIVTPLAFENTVLETKGKALYRNINVLEIPYFETSNVSGKTVYIGGEY